MSSGLDTIPGELRLEIFHLVFVTPRELSAGAVESKEGRQYSDHRRLWYEAKPLQNPALPLLLVSHQFHDEVQDIMARERANYTLIVLCHDDGELLPTWTTVPVLKTRINTIMAQFRIVAPPPDVADARKLNVSLASHHDEGPFYQLLANIFHGGPVARSAQRPVANFTIERLIIDIEIPKKEPEPEDVEQELENNLKAFEMVLVLSSFVDARLNLGMYQDPELGLILYESILGSIEFGIGGKLLRRFDMTQQLAAQPSGKYYPVQAPTPQSDTARTLRFAAWKTWVTERRSRCEKGLPDILDQRPCTAFREL